DLHFRPRPRQRRVDSRQLGLERSNRLPPPVEQLHAYGRALLVPRLEARRQAGIGEALLEESVPPRENLTEADQCRDVIRVEPSREPVDEIAPRRRRSIDDLEVLPPERDHARPVRGRVARSLPGSVLEPAQAAADGPPCLASEEI